MSNFLDDNINQTVLLDVNYLDVLGDNTFEYSLYKLITETLDLSEFNARYKNKTVGRKAYPPALLLRVIFYAYYRGVTSSRVIERFCKTDLKLMALASGRTPHFTTIADFVSSNCEAMKTLFHKILLICCKSGLVGKEHFAIDGCKLPSDASKEWSGTHKELKRKSDKLKASAQKIIDRHLSNDNDKNTTGGNKRRELQSIETLLNNAKKIDDFLNDGERRMGVGKRKKEVKSNVTDNESTKMTTSKGTLQGYNCQAASDELHQIVLYAEAAGVGQDQSLLKPMIEGIRKNLSDDIFDSGVLLTADTGYSSEENMGYLFKETINAIVPDNDFRQRDKRIVESESYQAHKQHRQKTRNDKSKGKTSIPASEFIVDVESRSCICPNGKEMLYLGDHFNSPRGNYLRFRGKLQDCRSCPMQSRCMKNPIKDQGRQVSFLPKEHEQESFLDLMAKRIDSEEGRRNYSRRMWTIEPVFGNITSNKRLNRITLRGKAKATGQWLMYCMVHNMEKLWRYA
ncbi:MAG: IS1182 family transposase [Pseudomonadales bacterium]